MPFTVFTRVVLLVAMLVLGAETVRANIGDDASQLATRYGKYKVIAGQLVFEKSGYSITVYFDGTHSAMEVFTRNTSDPAKSDLDKKDIDYILEGESDGNTWNPVKVPNGRSTWMRSDNKLIARYSPNSTGKAEGASVLVIMLNAK